MTLAIFALLLIAGDAERYRACAEQARSAPAAAEAEAQRWIVEGGGAPAQHCLGLARLTAGRFAEASAAFEAAARASGEGKNPRTADLWAQAGNAALLGGDAARARTMLDIALLHSAATDAHHADIRVDHARVAYELGDLAAARADLDAAVATGPLNADALLLSATLARRQERIADATRDIERVALMRPDDPDVLLERGNIAALNGDFAAARMHWKRLLALAPATPQAKAAEDALLRNPE